MTNDSNSSTEINVRLAIARQVMRQLTEIWKSAEISLKLKKQLVKSLVWSIALYGSESWAVKKCDEKRITAFENKKHCSKMSTALQGLWLTERESGIF